MAVVLDVRGALHPQDSATNAVYEFELDAPAPALRIEYAYAPKALADDALAEKLLEAGMEHCVEPRDRAQFPIHSFLPLVNLVTLSVDAPDGYRGCAHRHDPEQVHVLRERGSSPGFDDGPILAGRWRAVVNVHAVVTSSCEFHLRISTGAGEARLPESMAARPAEGRLAPDGWHFAEMHCHTRHSDGSFAPEELAQAAREAMLDGVALTDHNTMSGHAAMAGAGLPFIPGIEWTTFYGHMLALGAREYVDWRDATPDNIDEKMRAVRAAGGLVGVAHPFDLGSPMCTGCYWDFRVRDWNNVDYIEVWHGERPPLQWKARRAMDLWVRCLDAGCRVAPMYGRDWHGPAAAPELYAATMLGTGEAAFTARGAMDAIRRGRVMLTLGPAVGWTLSSRGRAHEVGDEIAPGRCASRVTVDASARRAVWERFDVRWDEAVLLGTGGRELARAPVTGGVAECELDVEPPYVRMELRGSALGRPCAVALSAPIYVAEAPRGGEIDGVAGEEEP